MFDLSFLQMQVYVATIAEHGSFARAARVLNTSATFLTRKIAGFEKVLGGVKLFDRTTRRLALTEAGRLLLPEMQTSIRHAERAWNLAHLYLRIWRGPVRIGYSPLVSTNVLALLHRIDFSQLESRRIKQRLEVPEPRIVLESAMTQQLIDAVLQGELHAALGVMPIRDSSLWVQPLMREGLCVCLPKNHPLVHRGAVSIRDLHRQVLYWIPRRFNPSFYDLVFEYIESTGAEVIYQEIVSLGQAIEMVSQGFGVALVPRTASRLSHGGVVFRNITDRYLQIETGIFARKDMMRESLEELLLYIAGSLQRPMVKLA